MKTKLITLSFALAIVCACTKEQTMLPEPISTAKSTCGILAFNSEIDLANYADSLSDSESDVLTKAGSGNIGFTSLWDSNRDAVLSSLDPSIIDEALTEGLEYEPEDEIIVDPIFAKISQE